MAVSLDLLTRVRNIHWKTDDQFLYSGEDGMHGSSDGESWTAAPTSVPALSLAFIDAVWIGCHPLRGVWRSVDGAKTWSAVAAPMFEQVVAFRPAGKDAQGNPKQGVFVAWCAAEDGEHQNVYASHNLGKTWAVVFSIETTVHVGAGGASGYEFINCLSGCGDRVFVSTVRNEGTSWADAGHIYSSNDGQSFSGGMVFGPPTFNPPGPFDDFRAYNSGGVGFDKKTQKYIACGLLLHIPSFGLRIDTLRYIESSDGSFNTPQEGKQFAEATSEFTIGETISGATSVAGGDGAFATGSLLIRVDPSGTIDGQIKAHFIPGGLVTDLVPVGSDLTQYVGSFCKKISGVFACVSYGPDRKGGVYIAKANVAFHKTHSGTGFATEQEGTIGGTLGGAVAVGRIGFPLGGT